MCFIAYKPALPPGSFLSVVVVQEMMAGARDRSEFREWEAAAQNFEQDGRLLVPTKEDWLLAGRVLHSLLHGLKSRRTGYTPRLHPDEKQRIIRDVLIARTVRRVNGLLITDNRGMCSRTASPAALPPAPREGLFGDLIDRGKERDKSWDNTASETDIYLI
ncbi:MAG: type II toxin-antitoxin system VapC family toxin [Blastocatellia bacterium]